MSEPESKSVESLDARGPALNPKGRQRIGAHGQLTADGQGGLVQCCDPATALPLRAVAPGPQAQVREFPGVGRAPTLMPAAQIEVVRRFLLAP